MRLSVVATGLERQRQAAPIETKAQRVFAVGTAEMEISNSALSPEEDNRADPDRRPGD
jgi:hypothetical protein